MTVSRFQRVKNAKETARCKWVLVVIQLFNIAVNDFDAKKSAHYNRVRVVYFTLKCIVNGKRRC